MRAAIRIVALHLPRSRVSAMTVIVRSLVCLLVIGGRVDAQSSARLAHGASVHTTWESSSPIVGHLHAGAVVTVMSHRAGYSHIASPGVETGWVYSRYLEEISSPPLVGPPAAATATVGVDGLKEIAKLSKPKPIEANGTICPNAGRSKVKLDSATNLLKNRVDEGHYAVVPFASVLSLPWQGMRTKRFNWLEPDIGRTADYEGAPISVSGYLVEVEPKTGETTNCGMTSDEWVDWHIWLVESADELDLPKAEQKLKSIVVETTPRVRQRFPNRFDIAQLREWARDRKKVQVSGWLMLDPEHPTDATGTAHKHASRGTIWEIHPVMKIELAH
jgi:uncharacterized protein YgiM (DUF1202 family)